MKRREFLTLAGAASVWPNLAAAQQDTSRSMPTVGFVGFADPDVDRGTATAFRRGMAELGYVEGQTIKIDARWSNGDVVRGHELIDALIALPVNVFLSPGPAAARAIVRKTKIPVVAVALPAVQSDPELFQSLARPGGTLTGFSAFGEEMSAKRIAMLKEVQPNLRTLGVMHNATDPTFSAWGDQTIADARKLGLEPVRLGLTSASPDAAARQIESLAAAGGSAMIVIRDFLTSTIIKDICKLAAEARIAVMGEHAEVARAGALFSYGADMNDLFRRAAGYVDQILKGQKPAEMPIQLPTKFELVVNLKTAQALGLTIPPTILVLSDQVIE
jgi:putative ABC transport system substrate-binding protein